MTGPPTRSDAPPRSLPADEVASLGSRLRHGPIVVAVSGQPDGAAPVRVAAALAGRYDAPVTAIQVLDTSAIPAPLPYAFGMARDLIGDTPYEADVRDRRRQFFQWLGRSVDWPVHIDVGTPAGEIVAHAEREGAALIVLGLRRHGIVDRVLRDETTLHVAQRARSPVLCVAPSLQTLPRQAIVGVDFGPASVRAAREALDVLAPDAAAGEPPVLRLLYVDRDGDAGERTAGAAVIARLGVGAAFQELIRELHAPGDVRVEWSIRRGTPAEELLAYAGETGADLIAVGSMRHERLERWRLGSVTTELVRDGRCSVLVIPPAPNA